MHKYVKGDWKSSAFMHRQKASKSVLTEKKGKAGNVVPFFVGSTLAHEVGHQLGLNHTTEQDGSSTALYDDVPVCGPENDTDGDDIVSPFECVGLGADNFMFWAADPSSPNNISAEQTVVLLDSPSGR